MPVVDDATETMDLNENPPASPMRENPKTSRSQSIHVAEDVMESNENNDGWN